MDRAIGLVGTLRLVKKNGTVVLSINSGAFEDLTGPGPGPELGRARARKS